MSKNNNSKKGSATKQVPASQQKAAVKNWKTRQAAKTNPYVQPQARKETMRPAEQKLGTGYRKAIRPSVSGPQLPNAPISKANAGNEGHKRSQIQERLKKKSPWFNSIVDPLHGADCKVPDETGVETGTLQLVERITVTTNAAGVAGCFTNSLYCNSFVNMDANGCNFQITTPTATPAALAWGDLAGNALQSNAFTGVSELKAVSNAHRIVSAAMYVQPEGSLSDNSGEFCMFSVPFRYGIDGTYTSLANLYKSTLIPLNANRAGQTLWYPLQREDWSFKSFIGTQKSVLSLVDSSTATFPGWVLGFCSTGVPAGVVFRVTIVVNYEFIPLYSTLNLLDISPSPSDAMETDMVETWVQDLSITGATSQKRVSSSPSTVAPKHEDDESGFGMIGNLIMDLAPLAIGALI